MEATKIYLLWTLLFFTVIITLLLYRRVRFISEQKKLIVIKDEHKGTLLREIHHRVKNNLQIISSLIELQIDKPDTDLYSSLREIQTKMRTIAIAHQMMYEETELKNVDLQTYFENMVATTFEILVATHSIQRRIRMNCNNLHPEVLISLALAVNEMLINTVKHVLPYVEHCFVEMECKSESGQLHFTYSDNGPGAQKKKLGKITGSGIRLIHQLARQMNAKLMVEIHKSGKVDYLIVFDQLPENEITKDD